MCLLTTNVKKSKALALLRRGSLALPLSISCWARLGAALQGAENGSPPVYSPEEQVKTFRFAEEGYRSELVAGEPLVEDPVAMAFDGMGRLWVVEMRGFMPNIDREGADDPVGRIAVLEDQDLDGRMDRRTDFLGGLVAPRAINVQPDGVLIGDANSLWFVSDVDGDLIPDGKELVDPSYASENVEHSANGLLRAMNN